MKTIASKFRKSLILLGCNSNSFEAIADSNESCDCKDTNDCKCDDSKYKQTKVAQSFGPDLGTKVKRFVNNLCVCTLYIQNQSNGSFWILIVNAPNEFDNVDINSFGADLSEYAATYSGYINNRWSFGFALDSSNDYEELIEEVRSFIRDYLTIRNKKNF